MADPTIVFGISTGAEGPLREFKAGDVIFKQGDVGHELFVVKRGKVEIRIGDRVLDTLSEGNILGEMALIDSAPRNATAAAKTDVTLVPVSETQFMLSVSNLALNIMRDMSRRLRKRAREAELMNIEAITASIVHEISQPLAAIAAYSGAAERFLRLTPPDLQNAQASLNGVVAGVRQTGEVVDGIRSLFRRADRTRQRIDMNEIIVDVLESVGAEFKRHCIMSLPELTTNLPFVDGNRTQLRQVILNLVRNGIEAMTTTDRSRVLRVKTERRGGDAIIVSVEDSGPGIDPKNLENLFDAFVTTKSHGMGLGLAICRMIANHHDGQLTVSSDGKNGALFEFTLPTGSAARAANVE